MVCIRQVSYGAGKLTLLLESVVTGISWIATVTRAAATTTTTNTATPTTTTNTATKHA